MRSFAFDEPRSSDRALYATQDLGAIEILLLENYFDTFDCLSREGGIDLPYVFVDNRQNFFRWGVIIIIVSYNIIFIS